jgi:hypothetical protein
MYHTCETSILGAGQQPCMYTHGRAFETFFLILFSIMTLAFSAATAHAPEKKGKVVGILCIIGFANLTYNAWLKTQHAFRHSS